MPGAVQRGGRVRSTTPILIAAHLWALGVRVVEAAGPGSQRGNGRSETTRKQVPLVLDTKPYIGRELRPINIYKKRGDALGHNPALTRPIELNPRHGIDVNTIPRPYVL